MPPDNRPSLSRTCRGLATRDARCILPHQSGESDLARCAACQARARTKVRTQNGRPGSCYTRLGPLKSRVEAVVRCHWSVVVPPKISAPSLTIDNGFQNLLPKNDGRGATDQRQLTTDN